MADIPLHVQLQLSLQRGLWGVVRPQLRQASIEADELNKIIRVRFEYDRDHDPEAQEGCSCAATEVMADFPEPWQLDEQHVSVPFPEPLSRLQHLAYLRAEPETEA